MTPFRPALLAVAFIFAFWLRAFWLRQSRPGGSTQASGVQRSSESHFDAAPVTVAQGVRTVLAQAQRYRKTVETRRDALFLTNVRPPWGLLKWLILGTEMTIELQPSSTGTKLTATTKSQSYITGDVLNFYEQYIRDFLVDLRREL